MALCLVLVAGVAYVVDPPSNVDESLAAQVKAEQAAQGLARRNLPAAMAALQHLRVPANFRPFKVGCRWYRCYLVPEVTPQVAPTLPAIIRNLGADEAQTRRLETVTRAFGAPMERYSDALLKRLGVRTGPSHVDGCDTTYNARHGVIVYCAEPAVIDDNVVSVFLGPYVGCGTAPCHWTNRTEVEISYPSGAPQAAGK